LQEQTVSDDRPSSKMKSQTQFFIKIGLFMLLFGIAWLSFSTRDQDPIQVYDATISRDCAPWDAEAFTVSIPFEAESVIQISIWQSADIKIPSYYKFTHKS
jgi:hypothetical protein